LGVVASYSLPVPSETSSHAAGSLSFGVRLEVDGAPRRLALDCSIGYTLGMIAVWSLATDLSVGLTYCVSGLVASGGRRPVRMAVLFESTGIAWLIGDFAPGLLDLYIGPLVHLLLAYPTGRINGRVRMALVVIAYPAGMLGQVLFARAAFPLLFALVAIAAVGAARGPSTTRRRDRAPAAAAAVAIAGAALALRLGPVLGLSDPDTGRVMYAVVLVASAVLLVAQLRWGGGSQDAVARLVVELGDRSEPVTLRRTLAEVLDDPSLVIGLVSGPGGTFVDETGQSVVFPAPGTDREVRALTVGEERVGILIRDARTYVDDTLIDGVSAAAQLAIANARLHADARDGLRGLAASRRRVVEAADAERSRIRTELEEGMERRLATAERLLGGPGDDGRSPNDGRSFVNEIRAIRAELAQLTLGIGSSVLLANGLAAAVAELVRSSSVPIELEIPARRWPGNVELTAYFVCSEGLANAARHSSATAIGVRVIDHLRLLEVEVVDNGIGGADPAGGSGLRGLADRVEAIGGALQVEGARSGGTRLIATLPLHELPERP
jgi:hypothetical protein